jgi:hypothetical protein
MNTLSASVLRVRGITVIDFLDIIYCPVLYLKQRFGDLNLSPSSGKKPAQLNPIAGSRPYLRTPEPEHCRAYVGGHKPSARVTIKMLKHLMHEA